MTDDGRIAAIVAAPPTAVSEVVRAMEEIDAAAVAGDGLKWFNWLYLNVTRAVVQRLAAGRLRDSTFLEVLDVEFANLYFNALRSWTGGLGAPAAWRALFTRRTEAPISRIQFAMAGINAHINRDLPVAIVQTCQKQAVGPVHGGPRYLDYTDLNPTLDALIATARRELHVRLLGDALPPVSHVENILAAWSVAAARESAWTNAEVLWTLWDQPLVTARYLNTLDGLASLAGKALLTPAPIIAAVTA
jgi:hypothetical protein